MGDVADLLSPVGSDRFMGIASTSLRRDSRKSTIVVMPGLSWSVTLSSLTMLMKKRTPVSIGCVVSSRFCISTRVGIWPTETTRPVKTSLGRASKVTDTRWPGTTRSTTDSLTAA